MADRISTRSASRRTTPQSPPKSSGSRSIPPQSPPRRTMPATRSRSHDVSDSEASRTNSKSNRRRAPRQVFTEVVGDTNKSRNRTRTRSKPNDLSTVTEHPSIIYPDLSTLAENEADADVKEERDIQRRIVYENKSPGDVSVFSGTTARTSRSAQELLGLEADDMLDALPDLSDASDKLLRFLTPPDTSNAAIGLIRHDLKDPESRRSKTMRRLCNSFRIPRDFYGSSLYIHSPAILRTLLRGNRTAATTYGPWRPDPLLQKANLCSMLLTVLGSSPRFNSDQAIEELEPVFPASFLHSFVTPEHLLYYAGSSALRNDTLKLGLELRTQYAIVLLTGHIGEANFDPDTILFEVFYQEKNRLRGWDFVGSSNENLPNALEDMIKHRVDLIREHFLEEPQASDLGELVDIERLKADFSWDDFVTGVVAWSKVRLDELQRQINVFDGDGAEKIKNALDLKIQDILKTDSLKKKSGPEVGFDDESPSEPSHAPFESVGTSSHPATLARERKGPVYKFNSPKSLPYAASRLRERFPRRSEPFIAQEALLLPPGVHVPGTARPENQPLTPSKKAPETIITSSAPVSMADGFQTQVHNDDDLVFRALSPESERDEGAAATKIMQSQAQIEADGNKENLAQGLKYSSDHVLQQSSEQRPVETRKPRLIDRQRGAVRINFDSQVSTQSGVSDSREKNDNGIQLSDGEDEQEQMSDASQDGGFQQDMRPNDVNSRRNFTHLNQHSVAEPGAALPRAQKRAGAPKETRNPKRRPRRSERPIQQEDDEEDDFREAVTQQNYNNIPTQSQIQNYKRVNASAKTRMAERPKKVQSRKAWTDVETETLLNLIEEHGTSWISLKKIDGNNGKLANRDQVALKDKARNMKLDFLKALIRLPRNFELIPLNKIQIERLRSLGIRYNTDTGTIFSEDSDHTQSDQD